MKRKLCRALGLLMSFVMLSGDIGSIAAYAAGDETVSENNAGEENVSENDSGEEVVSENEGSEDDEDPVTQEEPAEKPDDKGDYKLLDESLFKVLSCDVEARSYNATAKLTAEHADGYNYVLAIFTSKEDAEFFSDKDGLTYEELTSATDYVYTDTYYGSSRWVSESDDEDYYQYDYSVNFTGHNSSSLLLPDTTYKYRLAVYNYNNDTDEEKYYFITAPQTFKTGAEITESKVNFSNLTVTDHGYYKGEFTVSVNDPGNEFSDNPRVELIEKAEEGQKAKVLSTLYYNKTNNNYSGSFTKSEKDLQLRVAVYTGKGEQSYVYTDFVQDLYSDENVKCSASVNNTVSYNLIVDGEFTPYYKEDELNAYLYFKTASGSYYNSYNSNSAKLNDDGTFSVALTSYYNKPNTEYSYYVVIGYYDSGLKAVRTFGSKDEPLKYTTGEATVYTADDFVDAGLYEYLKNQYGESGITNATLSTVKSLSISSYYKNDFIIRSLADLPDKLPNLTSISMSSQDVTDIAPLLDLKYLTSVSLDYNDVAVLPDLSSVKWQSLSLNRNLLTEEAVAAAKIPESLNFHWSARKDEFVVADSYYIDSKGVFPIIIKYSGRKSGRTYTANVSINNIGKSYSDWESSYSDSLVVTTAKDDFGLEADTEYNAKITINDGFSDVKSVEKKISFVPMAKETEDQYVAPWANSFSVTAYPPAGEYESDSFIRLEVAKEDKIYFSTDYVHCYRNDIGYKLYYDIFETSYFNGLDYNTAYVSTSLSQVRVPDAGDYDLILTPREGEKIVWKNKIHVTDKSLVTGMEYGLSGYDNRGEYFYIELQGYNISKDKGYPVICDDKGTEYTTVVDVSRTSSTEYVYCLKKNSNWSEINKVSDETLFPVKLKGTDIIDQRRDDNKTIRADSLKDREDINYYPVQVHYNWKKQTFEFTFDSTVKKDTKLDFEFYSDYKRETKVASASAVVGDNGLLSLKPLNAEGGVYIPGKQGQSFTQYYAIVVGEERYELSTYVYWYNWHGTSEPSGDTDYFSYSLSKYIFAAPAESLEVTVKATAATHSTNALSVRIKDTSEVIALKYKKEKTYDEFTSGTWKFTKALAAGTYTVEIFETVNGEEKILGSTSIYVRDKDLFYTDYCYGSFDRTDLKIATVRIDLPLAGVPETEKEAELNKFIEKLKLKVEVFDIDYKPVSGLTITPTRGYSGSGALTFKVSGLDEDASCYYVRFTSNGKTPLDIYSDKEYYDDTAHGKKMTRSTGFGITDSSEYNAYYRLYTYELKKQPPFTLNFYALNEMSKLVQTITVKKDDLDGDYYYFTKNDVSKLDANTVYMCVVIANNQRVSTYTGYFASKDNGAAYNPNMLTLKKNKKENVSAVLQLNTNGADAVASLYTIAKNGKSAKMSKLTKKGYTFKGWYVTYRDKKNNVKTKKIASITAKTITKYAINGTLTLNAQFNANTYTVKYNKTAMYMGSKVKVSGKIKSEKIKYSDDGKTVKTATIKGGEIIPKDATIELKGWTTVKNGTEVMFEVGSEVSMDKLVPAKGKTITLYAVYGKKN